MTQCPNCRADLKYSPPPMEMPDGMEIVLRRIVMFLVACSAVALGVSTPVFVVLVVASGSAVVLWYFKLKRDARASGGKGTYFCANCQRHFSEEAVVAKGGASAI